MASSFWHMSYACSTFQEGWISRQMCFYNGISCDLSGSFMRNTWGLSHWHTTVHNICIQYLLYIILYKVVFCSCSIQEIIIVICIYCFFVGIFFCNLFIYLHQPLCCLCALHFGITGNINSLKMSCFLVWRHTILSTLPCIHVIVIQNSEFCWQLAK